MKTTIISLAIAVLIAVISCKKDSSSSSSNNNSTPALSKAQLLTAHTWKLKAVYFGFSGTKLDDISMTEDPCWFDNTFVFNSNGTFSYSDGVNGCISASNYSGTWVMSADKTTVTTTSTHDTTTYTFGVLDDNTLELSSYTDDHVWETRDEYIKK